MINFFKGHPSSNLLPALEIKEAAVKVLDKCAESPFIFDKDPVNRHPLTYGEDMGNLDVRTAIANWEKKRFGYSVDPECINLTAGASYGAMNILAQTTSRLSRRAFIVSPTYFLINEVFIDAGFGGKVSTVEEDSKGQLDLASLESQLKFYDSQKDTKDFSSKDCVEVFDPKRGEKKLYRYAMYLVPTFCNPTGSSLNMEARLRLVELARKHDMLIISDDVYDLLDYTGSSTPLPRLSHIDATHPGTTEYGNVVSNATFSKIISPGLRVGWQETGSSRLAFQISQGGANKSGGTPAQLNSLIVAELIESGVLDEKIIPSFVDVYSKRTATFLKAAKEYLPEGTKISGGQGGYFVWVTMPPGYDGYEMVRLCRESGVVLAGGETCEVTGNEKGWGKSCVRVCISYLSEDELVEGVKIWGDVCRKLAA